MTSISTNGIITVQGWYSVGVFRVSGFFVLFCFFPASLGNTNIVLLSLCPCCTYCTKVLLLYRVNTMLWCSGFRDIFLLSPCPYRLQPQNSWLSHFLTLWPPHLEQSPPRHQALCYSLFLQKPTQDIVFKNPCRYLFSSFFDNIFHLDVHYVCMLVQRFEPQGRRFTNFH